MQTVADVRSLISSSSTEVQISRYLLGLLVSLWVISTLAPLSSVHWLALEPGTVLSRYYIWTFFTAGFYDTSFVLALVNIVVFVLVAPSLERAWGSRTFVKFILVVNALVFSSLFVTMAFAYYATFNEALLFKPLCGLSGINAGFAIALKQKFPDKSVVPSFDALKIKHIPVVLWTLATTLWLFGRIGGKEAPLVFFGTFYAWLYLRFFLVDQDTHQVGDLRPEFAFATLFPDVLGIRPVVTALSIVTYRSLLRLGFFQESFKTNQTLPETQPSTNTTTAAANDPFVYRAVDPTAERRRILAIKAIDEKLAELAKAPQANFSEEDLNRYATDEEMSGYPKELAGTAAAPSTTSSTTPSTTQSTTTQ